MAAGCPNNLFQTECQLLLCNSGWPIVNDFSRHDLNDTFSLMCNTGFGGGYAACGLCSTVYPDYKSCCTSNPAGGDAAFSCMNNYISSAKECTEGADAAAMSSYTSQLTAALGASTAIMSASASATSGTEVTTSSAETGSSTAMETGTSASMSSAVETVAAATTASAAQTSSVATTAAASATSSTAASVATRAYGDAALLAVLKPFMSVGVLLLPALAVLALGHP
ncbi:hypothetical protein LTR95_001238 [Oleoguttula sp. CCFEE 5521]